MNLKTLSPTKILTLSPAFQSADHEISLVGHDQDLKKKKQRLKRVSS